MLLHDNHQNIKFDLKNAKYKVLPAKMGSLLYSRPKKCVTVMITMIYYIVMYPTLDIF